jgi:hypothetical protein
MIEKELLFKARLAEEDYDIPDVGTVRIRILSWDECAAFEKWAQTGRDGIEVYRRILATALVDPILTEEEVGEWMRVAPAGEIENLARHVIRISGLVEGAQKSV